MEQKITANKVIDALCIPSERLKALCFLHQETEQKLYNTRNLMTRVDNASALKGCVERCLGEIDSYVFMIGEMVYETRDAVLELVAAAQEEADATFDKRQAFEKKLKEAPNRRKGTQ